MITKLPPGTARGAYDTMFDRLAEEWALEDQLPLREGFGYGGGLNYQSALKRGMRLYAQELDSRGVNDQSS